MKKIFMFWCAFTLVLGVAEVRAQEEHPDLIVDQLVSVQLMEAFLYDDYSMIEVHYGASVSLTEPFEYLLFQYNDLFTTGYLPDTQVLPGYDFLVNTDAHQILISPNIQNPSYFSFEFQWNTSFVNTSPDLIATLIGSPIPLIPLEDASWSTGDDPYREGIFSQPSDMESSLVSLNNNPDRIWHHSFYGGITLTPEEHPVLLIDTSAPTNPVPEPATMLLLSSGLVGFAGVRRRFKKQI